MPLASTVKIIIAIEYTCQAAKGKINPLENISMKDLEKYYVFGTDGNAHPGWLNYSKKLIINDSIPLKEVASGMIMFSSNANTDFLINKLGIDNINSLIKKLEMVNHTNIYPIVAALYINNEAFPGMKEKKQIEHLRKMSDDIYWKYADEISAKMKTDTLFKNKLTNFGPELQKVWSDRLPASTVKEYNSLMKKINSRTYFDTLTQLYLDEVMEFMLKNPSNKKWLQHVGTKGGSTAWILTKTMYATDKNGNKTEITFFFNDLNEKEHQLLTPAINGFELNILTDPEFRKELMNTLRPK